MKIVLTIVALLATAVCGLQQSASSAEISPVKVRPNDWQWWRGPNRDGIAVNQHPPSKWSDTDNIVWRTPVPGRGHSSPTVYGHRVFLATGNKTEQTQSVLCFNKVTGKVMWSRVVHQDNLERKGNKKSTHASGSVACDGEQVYISFVNNGAVYTTALSLTGKRQWQTKINDYVTHQGYGASPIIHGELVLVSADNKGGGALAGLKRSTGKIVWKRKRPATPNYSSPSPVKIGGKDQLLLSGCRLITSFDPVSGKKLWEIPGATTECVTTMVSDGNLVFTSGGYPKNHVMAVRASDQKVIWQKTTRVYVPSMIVYKKHLYAITDAGVAHCWNCKSGNTAWKSRLGGVFTSSLALADGNIYATNEKGVTFVYGSDPKRFVLISKNQLGSECYSSPAFAEDQIFTRVAARTGGKRQEYLVCIGK